MAGMIGSLAALEVLRALHPFGADAAGKLLLADTLDLRFRTLSLPKDPGEAVERLLADQLRHGVGQLDLAPRTLFLALEDAHHFRLQNVAAGDHQVRRRGALCRFFDQRRDLGQPPVYFARRDDAIFVRLAVGHFQRTDDIAADLVIGRDHLGDEARRADHQFVGQQNRERLVADDLARAPDSVAET
ncbi:hypothetical protein WR25_18433 [Diploscapter pachys]|uniref:Uncharacterized protein n=1 Tax=Diploscapter pachys TaxID=2018661 RepID=A0A2A2M1V0_9BILA|nr:hypothetical protein WR25_18433 [Diploscapter pachys]